MKPHQRVASMYLSASSDLVYVREEDEEHFYIVLYRDASKTSEIGFINANLRTFDLSTVNDLTNAPCIRDVRSLVQLFPSLQRRGSWVTVLVMYESDLDPDFRSQGIGKRLYLECIKEGWKDNKRKPFIFVPHYCIDGKTSNDAKRVWTSLARKYPSSGDCIAILQEP